MDLSPAGLAVLAVAAAGGALVQAATGFGFAILAAPVFLAVLDSTAAVPILVGLHLVQSVMLVPRLWREVPRPLLRRLVLGALAGCPLGLALFRVLDVGQLKLAAGVVILAVAGLLALRRLRPAAPGTQAGSSPASLAAALATGSLSGAMTALLVMPGPPLMAHLMHRPLAPPSARALSLTFFAVCYAAVLAISIAAGGVTAGDWQVMALLAAPVIAGTIAGRGLAPRLTGPGFTLALNVLLALAGLGALLSAL